MATPTFIFTSFGSSFKVVVENLETLSIEQIQMIELFVKNRKGVFDFTNYSFSIQKKIDFFEFEKLISNSGLRAHCILKELTKRKNYRVGFGQYKGMFYSELPDSYLVWLKSNYIGSDKKHIESEIKKRRL